jgi:acetoin utilization protein AcuB
MLVRNRMTGDVVTASPDTTLAQALELTRAHAIRHLPIVADGALVGIVSNRDLRLAHPPVYQPDTGAMQLALHSIHLAEIMITNVITAAPEATIEEAARLLCTHPIGCLPVVTDGALVGIITESDLLRAMAEMIGASVPASRIEVRMPNRTGELARVVRLLGIEMRINILGMFAPVSPAGECQAVIHLQTGDARPVVDALRALGYQAGSPAIELDPMPQEPYVARRVRPAMQI